jgi:hypothetical protein
MQIMMEFVTTSRTGLRMARGEITPIKTGMGFVIIERTPDREKRIAPVVAEGINIVMDKVTEIVVVMDVVTNTGMAARIRGLLQPGQRPPGSTSPDLIVNTKARIFITLTDIPAFIPFY